MNVTESKSWLSDRQSELDSAKGKLASLEVQLQQAEQDFSKTNGEPSEFVTARDRVQHIEHQLSQARQSIATCSENVRCAQAGLERAQCEARIAELTAQRVTRREQVAALANDALGHYERFASVLKQLDALQQQDPPDVTALRALDQQPRPLQVVDVLLLQLMSRNPGHIASAYICSSQGYRANSYETAKSQGLHATLGDLLGTTPMPPDRIAAFRSSLGDSDAQEALALAALATDRCIDFKNAFREGYTFGYDVHLVPPDGHQVARVRFDKALPEHRQVGVSRITIISDEVVDLGVDSDGLALGRARLVRFSDGSFRLLAPPEAPSLASRVVGAVVGLMSPQP